MTSSVYLILHLGLLPFGVPPAAQESEGLVTARIEDRIVKTFDFDERKLGNYETMPRSWRQIREPGFPRFLEPSFDFQVGHDARPSFRFALDGGNVGAVYVAKDINVHPDAEYQVTAWVRPSQLVHAHACITAYYLDHAFQKIEASERSSVKVSGAGLEEPWIQVSISLPGGFENARWLGLSCLVEQAPAQAGGLDELRPINYSDVRGTAWFDDIKVLRLPRLTLELGAVGNVFTAEQEVQCLAGVADLSGADLDAKLEVIDAEQQVVQVHSVSPVALGEHGVKLRLDGLAAGLYSAVLSVRVGEGVVLTRRQSFVRLNPDLPSRGKNRRGFGLILESPSEVAAVPPSLEERLVQASGVGTVKVPLWRRDMSDEAIVEGDGWLDALMRRLHEDGVEFVAALQEPPETLARLCGHPKLTLIDVLTSPPEQWRPYLAFIIARYGRQVRAWQVGVDGQPIGGSDERLSKALANVRNEMKPLIGSADLAIPRPVQQVRTAAAASDAEIASLTVPQHLSAAVLAEQLASAASDRTTRLWANIEPPSSQDYDRKARLIELARRIIVARHSGIDTVFLRQPWDVREGLGEAAVEPTEDFIICRTLAQALGGLEAVSPIWLDHGVHAWLFGDAANQAGAIAAWTEADEEEGRNVVLDVGPAARQIDMWGDVRESGTAAGGQVFRLGGTPTIIAPVSLDRGKLLAGFTVGEPTVQATIQQQRRTITLTNTLASKMHGSLTLSQPPRWRIEPCKVPIDLAPGEQAQVEVSFVVPGNQAVGECVLQGRLALDGSKSGGVTLRTPLYVSSPGIDVGVTARSEGREVAVFQRVTNLTEQSLDLQAMIVAPSRPPQNHMIMNLPPGQSAVREYRLDGAAGLRGKPIRVSVEQINGAIRNNTLLTLD